MPPNINSPIPEEWTSYVTQTNLGLEVIPDQLYDTQLYDLSATPTELTFPSGSTDKSRTNIPQSGVLPSPQSFLIHAVRLYYRITLNTIDQGAAGALASAMNDIALLQNTGRFLLEIGEKKYGPWRMWTMPAGAGLQVNLAAAGAEAANLVSGYGTTLGFMWVLDPYLMLAPLQNFSFRLDWTTTVTTSADIDVEVLFAGQRARSIQ